MSPAPRLALRAPVGAGAARLPPLTRPPAPPPPAQVALEEGITKYDKRMLGFFITTAEAQMQLQQDLEQPGSCVLKNPNVDLLFTFSDMDVEKKEDASGTYFEFPGRIPPDQGGEYSLFFANCEPHVDVTAHIHVELYNEAWTGSRDYLSAGEAPLPLVYTVMAIFYAVAAAIWIAVLYHNRATTLRIHWLMLSLVVVKCVATGCEAGMFHMKRITGEPDGWNVAFYIFSFVRGILLFAVIVLIGTGWSFLKPFLSDKEKRARAGAAAPRGAAPPTAAPRRGGPARNAGGTSPPPPTGGRPPRPSGALRAHRRSS